MHAFESVVSLQVYRRPGKYVYMYVHTVNPEVKECGVTFIYFLHPSSSESDRSNFNETDDHAYRVYTWTRYLPCQSGFKHVGVLVPPRQLLYAIYASVVGLIQVRDWVDIPYDLLIFYFDLRSVHFSSVSSAPFDTMDRHNGQFRPSRATCGTYLPRLHTVLDSLERISYLWNN